MHCDAPQQRFGCSAIKKPPKSEQIMNFALVDESSDAKWLTEPEVEGMKGRRMAP
jgi:hypothetical protein